MYLFLRIGLLGVLLGALSVGPVSVFSQDELQVGYAFIDSVEGDLPVATALFAFRNSEGILVSEAGVAGVQPGQQGRIFVDGSVATGLALANASSAAQHVDLTLRSADGTLFQSSQLSLGVGQHVARFVNELFEELPSDFLGSLEFRSSDEEGIAALTIRQALNSRGEPLLTTLPVATLSADATPAGDSPPSIVFPHLGAGDTLSTQILLINTRDRAISGVLRLFASDGQPLVLDLDGTAGSAFEYSIPANGVFHATLRGGDLAMSGYAVATADQDSSLPVGTAVFQFRDSAGRLVSEAGVAAVTPTTRARIFVDTIDTRTGVAVALPGNGPTTVQFRLLDANGLPLGVVDRQVPADGHFALFVGEVFDQLPPGFTGVLEIEAPVPFVPVTLKLTVNQRGDLILTTLPVADLSSANSATRLVFPQVGFGRGFETRIILIGDADPSEEFQAGTLELRQSDGTPLLVPLLGETNSVFQYGLPVGGVSQLRPGVGAVASLVVVDPNDPAASEFVVNQGEGQVLRPLVLDVSGAVRPDIPLTFTSIDPEVATVDALGRIDPLQPGFATFTIGAGPILESITVTVVGVVQGGSAFGISGIDQDATGRLFMASADSESILRAEGVGEDVLVYAGEPGAPGLVDAVRQDARFSSPSFLVLDRASGVLYVSDTRNHAIRRVRPGPTGTVDTIAGTGLPGRLDGPALTASFDSPAGLAVDSSGHLWIADTLNHTIRRLDLASGRVSTIAGTAGERGFVDSVGGLAHFDSPLGIAVEPVPLAERLEQELSGGPLLVRVLVADSGNGVLRRVWENGRVETLDTGSTQSSYVSAGAASGAPPPRGVTTDPVGNIYVVDSDGGARSFLTDGRSVPLVSSVTRLNAVDITVGQFGAVHIGQGDSTGVEVRFGPPMIDSVSPSGAPAGGGTTVTIMGRNFPPDTQVVIGADLVEEAQVLDSRTLRFTTTELASGRTTLTVKTRGGVAQQEFLVEAIPLEELATGEISTIAGGSIFAGDGGPATRAAIGNPIGIALDNAGNLFVAEFLNQRIRRIDGLTKTITTVGGAGCGATGDVTLFCRSGDGGPALAASIIFPQGIAFDASGDLLVAERDGHRVRRIDHSTGIISTVAGTGEPGFSEGEPAAEAQLDSPVDVLVTSSGDILIADRSSFRVLRVSAETGLLTTLAGNGDCRTDPDCGYSGEDIPALEVSFDQPVGLAEGPAGHIYVAQRFGCRVSRIHRETGLVRTIAGLAGSESCDDGATEGPATSIALQEPTKLAFDLEGRLLITERSGHRLRRVDLDSGLMVTLAGVGSPGFSGDGGSAVDAELDTPFGVAVDGSGRIFIADGRNERIRMIDADGIIQTTAGTGATSFLGDGGPANAAAIRFGSALAIAPNQDIVLTDNLNHLIRRVQQESGFIDTVVGTGSRGHGEENVPGLEAQLNFPSGVSFDGNGNLLIADYGNHRVRRLDISSGLVATIAGVGLAGFDGDGGPATGAPLRSPRSVIVDAGGNILIADQDNHRIRLVDALSGIIDTIAGNTQMPGFGPPPLGGFSGDGGPAIDAELSFPAGLFATAAGELFFADVRNHRIRVVDLNTGIINTVAGSGPSGEGAEFSGDGGLATEARLRQPRGVFVDEFGNLFIADHGNHRIRRVDGQSGIIETIAGSSTVSGIRSGAFGGDGGPAVAALLNTPSDVALDADRNLILFDARNGRLRIVRGPVP